MTTRKRNPAHNQAISQAQQTLAANISQAADKRLLERSEAGTFVAKVSPTEWDWAIEQIRGGDTDANICRHLNIHKGTIAVKRREDAAFATRYLEALEDAFVTIAQETRAVARGHEGYSTGDVQRDRLVVETDLKLASKFSRKLLGDKLEIDQRQVIVNIKGDSDDLC